MGSVQCRVCNGTGRFWSKSGKRFDCKACGGSGTNASLWATHCRSCFKELIYKAYSDEPKYCSDCRKEELERVCQQLGCNNTIRYKRGWENIPEYCKRCESKRNEGFTASRCEGTSFLGCGKLVWSPPGKSFTLCRECNEKKRAEEESKWREKPCKNCGRPVRYLESWNRIPSICKDCRERGADIFRSSLIPAGWGSAIGYTQVDKAHGIMVFKGMGTNGADYRVSWNGYGEFHWTDQGIKDKNDPDRHRDPR